jgi:capsular polysaccharide biosynthesis protein
VLNRPSSASDEANQERPSDTVDGFGAREALRTPPTTAPVWVASLYSSWKLLALGTCGAIAVAAIVSMLSPTRYTAETVVAPTRSHTQVAFEPRITTVDQTAASATTPERRQALADLVTSSSIEAKVISQLSGTISASELRPGDLLGRIRGDVKLKSELIAVRAEAATPADAVVISNTWARTYVDEANRLYGGGDAGPPVAELEKQRDDALALNQAAQASLVNILRDNPADALGRTIADKQHRVGLLLSAYQAGAFSSVVAPSPTDPSVPNAQAAPLNSPVDTNAARDDYRLVELRALNDMGQGLRRLDSTRQSAQALLSDNTTAGSATSAAAVVLLKAQLVTVTDGLLGQLQFQVPTLSGSDTAADLRALIVGLDDARAKVAATFDARRQAYEADRQSQIAALESDLRQLRSDREAADAARKELTLKRDVSWDTYTALARKVEERRVAEAALGREVEIAAPAVAAIPASSRLQLTLSLAGVAGFVVTALLVLVRAYAPSSDRRRVVPRAGLQSAH